MRNTFVMSIICRRIKITMFLNNSSSQKFCSGSCFVEKKTHLCVLPFFKIKTIIAHKKCFIAAMCARFVCHVQCAFLHVPWQRAEKESTNQLFQIASSGDFAFFYCCHTGARCLRVLYVEKNE